MCPTAWPFLSRTHLCFRRGYRTQRLDNRFWRTEGPVRATI
ncbi:UNVERIFIED_CONTAM: hypothetical protein GTU68_009799 [Idotea baltica]|nr:hypothetical protein [Idotea baltica]